ncbi:MAG: DNA polymerase III subunit delta [Chromatiales bacterium]|jgi:DNA polymerase-3 subunit delta
MRLAFHELASHLKKELKPVYLISGDEPLQLGEAADLVRRAARQRGYSERKILEAGGQFDWSELTAECNSLSLFAEQRILDLRISNGKPGAAGGKALSAYADNPPEDTLLLITLPKLDQQQQKSKWYKALDRIGALVPVWPITGQRLPPWIEQRMRQKGLTPEPQVINMLAERVEGNLLAAVQEIEKLLLLNGPGIISSEQLAASVADSARFDVYGLIDAALLGKAKRCVRILNGLQQEGTPVAVVLWALSREIRQLAQMAHDLKQGKSLNQVFTQYRVWDKRKPLVSQGLKRLSLPQWRKLLSECARADLAVKGQLKTDSWLLLQDISLQVAGLSMEANQQIGAQAGAV